MRHPADIAPVIKHNVIYVDTWLCGRMLTKGNLKVLNRTWNQAYINGILKSLQFIGMQQYENGIESGA